MSSLANKFDIQYRIHFLDCQSNSIERSLTDQNVLEHLYRAATDRIFHFDRKYQREEADRVTDIDQVSIVSTPASSSKTISIPIEIANAIPVAPPMPPSLDAAIQLQKQEKKISSLANVTPQSLWANIDTQNISKYFDEITNKTSSMENPMQFNESKSKTVLDTRKDYNLGMFGETPKIEFSSLYI